jgi:hypothetical protein
MLQQNGARSNGIDEIAMSTSLSFWFEMPSDHYGSCALDARENVRPTNSAHSSIILKFLLRSMYASLDRTESINVSKFR